MKLKRAKVERWGQPTTGKLACKVVCACEGAKKVPSSECNANSEETAVVRKDTSKTPTNPKQN